LLVDALMQVGRSERGRTAVDQTNWRLVGRAQSVEAELGEALTRLSGLTRGRRGGVPAKSIQIEAYRIRAAEPGTGAGRAGRRGWPGRERVLMLRPGVTSSAIPRPATFTQGIRGRKIAEADWELETAADAGRTALDQWTQKVISAGLQAGTAAERDGN